MKKTLIGLAALIAMIISGLGAGAVSAQDRGHHGGGGGGFGRGGYEHGGGFGREGGSFQGGGRGGFALGGGERIGGAPGYGGRGYGGAGYSGAGYGVGGARQEYRPQSFGRGGGYSGGYAGAPVRVSPAYGGASSRGGSARGYTRGQFLPPSYLGGAVADPRQYHLRRPPNGYGWVTVGPNAYLTQRSTGLILDTAPLY